MEVFEASEGNLMCVATCKFKVCDNLCVKFSCFFLFVNFSLTNFCPLQNLIECVCLCHFLFSIFRTLLLQKKRGESVYSCY